MSESTKYVIDGDDPSLEWDDEVEKQDGSEEVSGVESGSSVDSGTGTDVSEGEPGVSVGEEGVTEEPEEPTVTEEPAVVHTEVYEKLRSSIASGGFKLDDMLNKIALFFIDGQITEDEYTELVQYARDNASVDSEVQENTDIVKELMQKVTQLEASVTDITNRVAKLEDSETEDPKPVLYEPYNEHKWYYKDMTCSYNGSNYICIAPDGVVCTWSPEAYPSYWQKVEA